MLNLVDKNGKQFDLDLQGMRYHQEAMDAKLTFRQYVNQKFPTASDQPETFKQMCFRAGIRLDRDPETGRPASTLREVLEPSNVEMSNQSGGTYTSMPQAPDSRILFAPAIMEAVENAMETQEASATAAFESLIGYRETVAATRIEQPVINYGTKGGPEDAAFSRQGQNSRPNVVLSITASDISRTIPATSFGLEISKEAQSNNLDFIVRTMARFYQKADFNEWAAQLLLLLNGNPDAAVTPMDDGTAGLSGVTAQSFDAGVTAAGTLSQLAYLKYLHSKSMTMVPDKLITDFNGALALENRADRPTNVMNNSTDRLDAPYHIIYPNLVDKLGVVILPDEVSWPVNTMLGLQSKDAIAKITSSAVEYAAIEEQVMKKSTEMRFDRGFIIYRMYTDAFSLLNLTVA